MENLIEYPIPNWLKILFLIVIPTPLILTTLLVKSGFNKTKFNTVFKKVGVFFVFYVIYITALGLTGNFKTVFFPPKVLLFTTFPFAFFLFFYIVKTSSYKTFIKKVALTKLVGVHIFRLIGIFFVLIYCYDALPKWFALIAGFGDVLTAITSIWLVKLIKNKHTNYKKTTWFWNTFGLIDIIFTAISANVLTKLSIDQNIMGVDALAMFPFFYIPAIAPPIIILLHYSIYLKLKNNNISHFLT